MSLPAHGSGIATALPGVRGQAVLALVLGVLCTGLDGSVIALALPGIARDFEVHAGSTIWVVNAFQLTALGMLLPCAALGGRWGYRRVYLGGSILFAAASLACILAPSLPLLSAARAFQGLGAACMMSVSSALLRLVYPRPMFARGLAINSAAVAFTAVAGPSWAAAVLSVTSWKGLFVSGLVLGPAVLLLGVRALPSDTQPATDSAFRPLDMVLNASMFGLCFLGAQLLGQLPPQGTPEAADAGADLWLGGLLLAAGLAVGAAYLRGQGRRSTPMFPLDLLRLPVFRLSMATSVSAFCAQTMAFVALPFLLMGHWQRSAAEAGLLMTLWPLALITVLPLVARAVARHSGALLGSVGMGCLCAGLLLLALLPDHPSMTEIGWRLALCGLGYGIFQYPNNHTILTCAPVERAAAAGGMLSTARLTGQSLGAVAMVPVFAVFGEHAGPPSALLLAACSAALAGVFSACRRSAAP